MRLLQRVWKIGAIAALAAAVAACGWLPDGSRSGQQEVEATIGEPGLLAGESSDDHSSPAGQASDAVSETGLPAFMWRAESDLPYNFLIGELGDKLLVGGHDGGFSGMHDASNLYALDRQTGEKLWQVDYGFNLLYYAAAEDEKSLAYLEYLAEKNNSDQSFYRLSTIDTDSGRLLWELELEVDTPVWEARMAVARNTVQLLLVRGDQNAPQSQLQSYDMTSGKLLWEHSFAGGSSLRSNRFATPVVLLQKGGLHDAHKEIQGLDAATGTTLWTQSDREFSVETVTPIQEDLRNISHDQQTTWTLSDSALLLIEAATGKELLELPIDDTYAYSQIDGRHMLQRHATDGERLYESKAVATSLIDTESGEPLWSVAGSMYRGAIDGDIFYGIRDDGTAMALDRRSGEELWAADTSAELLTVLGDHLYVKTGAEVSMLDKHDGSALGRLPDVQVDHFVIGESYYSYGLITNIRGELYVGSKDGYFTRLVER